MNNKIIYFVFIMDEEVDEYYEYEYGNFDLEELKSIENFEKIPENDFGIKVTKEEKKVLFDESTIRNVPINKPIPKQQAKLVRPVQPQQREKISYDDILSKMGMYVVNGQLHLKNEGRRVENEKKILKSSINDYKEQQNVVQQNVVQQNVPQNSYIYNKYFKDALVNDDGVRVPRNMMEYRNMLISDIIQRARIKQMKSRKMVLSNSNITTSVPQKDLNKLFSFSQR